MSVTNPDSSTTACVDRNGQSLLLSLPTEVWSMIAYFAPRMPDQPIWRPWTKLRCLSRTFKWRIEEYYVEHYLPHLEIRMLSLPEELTTGRRMRKDGHFKFDGFTDETGRVVCLREKQIRNGYRKLMVTTFSEIYRQHKKSASRWLMVLVHEQATDLLPVDLKAHFEPGNYTLTFDWRTYLSTHFGELRLFGILQSLRAMSASAIAASLMDDQLEAEITSKGFPTNEGLWRAVRRKRRMRIGLKSGTKVCMRLETGTPGAYNYWKDREGNCRFGGGTRHYCLLKNADPKSQEDYARDGEWQVRDMMKKLECQEKFGNPIFDKVTPDEILTDVRKGGNVAEEVGDGSCSTPEYDDEESDESYERDSLETTWHGFW